MEFKTLKNIESSFRHLRLFSMLFLGACTLISVAAVWTSYRFAEAQRQKIYVLDQGKSLILALSQDMAQNRPVEAREHVRRFHELFFTLSPDREAIEGTVRESNVTERTLVTTCRLRNAVRSDNNPQGFLIEDLRILENKDLGSYER